MKLKRIMAAILAIAQIATFTGCSEAEEKETTTEATTQVTTEATTIGTTTQETAETTTEEEFLEGLTPFDMTKDEFINMYNLFVSSEDDSFSITEDNTTIENNKLIITLDSDTKVTLYLLPDDESKIELVVYESKVDFIKDSFEENFLLTISALFVTFYQFEEPYTLEYDMAQKVVNYINRAIENGAQITEIGNYGFYARYYRKTGRFKVRIENWRKTS